MTDTLTPDRRSWNMSRIRGKDTRPELALRSLLHRSGYRFRLHDGSLPGRPDIVMPKYRTAIFVNGCFWHRHQDCRLAYTPVSRTEFWVGKFAATVERDSRNAEALKRLGWKVLIVWECELRNSPVKVLEEVTAHLREAA
jgi:DNA mismatch endonuclease (patch repair protein)